jgi:pyruvate/2-oxoglutarate/acetoin dehydrogenase E1 component
MIANLRKITYAAATCEAVDQCMEEDGSVFLFGLGADDPKRIFGTTTGLKEKYGNRVFDAPVSENALTGIAIGAATMGQRPILTHQRLDFALLSLDQIINNAAKWHYMFAGKHSAPIVIRMIIGRGWGQGPQHSQSLQALFAHIPGLKVIMPSTPHDAKGLMVAAIEDNSPVISLEHRWLLNAEGPVPEPIYREPLCKAKVTREGSDITIVATSYMVFEAYRAAEALAKCGIEAEVIDLRTIAPFDGETIAASVRKTGRLLVCDTGHTTCGVSGEIVAWVTERLFGSLKAGPRRIASPDSPVPTTPELAKYYYPRSSQIAATVMDILGMKKGRETESTVQELLTIEQSLPSDVPDLKFSGPF